jgi:tetratricopeptide (TPR) repeat protein
VHKTRLLLLAGVLLAPALVFLPSLSLGFNPFWDLYYVQNNPFQRPLTPSLFQDAFSSFLEGNYHPLTLLSHSLDYSVWAFIPFGHHLASYLLHLLNVLMVFLAVEALAGRAGASRPAVLAGISALIFGVHPLRVESVVWVTERKDVLFAFFYLLSLLSYIRGKSSRSWYLFSLALFGCSLLSKATSVSFPFVLCLLDHDLLSAAGEKSWRRSCRRALPFALLAVFIAGLAILGQSRSFLMAPVTPGALLRNLGEVPAVLFFYVAKTLWPLHLAPIYPIGILGGPWIAPAAGIGFLAVLAAALAARKRHPVFLLLCLLTIALLTPTVGILRVGAQVLADRFSLLSMIPVAVIIAAACSAARRHPLAGKAAVVLLLLWIGFLIGKTATYASLWDDAVALTRQAYDLYPDSPAIKEFLLGSYNNSTFDLIARGKFDEAEELYRRALAVDPDYPVILRNLGLLHLRRGRIPDAAEEFAAAIRIQPRMVEAYHDLSRAWTLMGKPAEAIAVLEEGVEKNPSSLFLRSALINAYREEGLKAEE